MSNPNSPGTPDANGNTPNRTSGLPGTGRSGLVFYEYVNIERKVSGTWTAQATNIPATFEPVRMEGRTDLAAWTHKPLFGVWLMPTAPVQDGDRIVRYDGSHWYVRGTPLVGPGGTHRAALVEGAAEDGMFAALNPAEPA
ncbi:MAG: hypothetical protein ABJA67_14195 [Chthonomonadales bacterium]